MSLIKPSQIAKFAGLIAIYLIVVYLIPRPDAVKPEGWRLSGIFFATIGGLMLQPIPGAALVLLAVTLFVLSGALTISSALQGYADSSVWLVVAAFMISRSLLNTGLARRIALFFVRILGKSSYPCHPGGPRHPIEGAVIATQWPTHRHHWRFLSVFAQDFSVVFGTP